MDAQSIERLSATGLIHHADTRLTKHFLICRHLEIAAVKDKAMKISLAPTLLILTLLAGCADTHVVTRSSSATITLSRQASVYIAVPTDGVYERRVYTGSGALTAQAIAAAFSPMLQRVTVAIKMEDIESAQRSARAGKFDYLIYPQILHWEDRATEWSGRPDVVSVKVSLVRVDSGDVVDSTVVGGKSGLGTFGGDRPEHLLPKPLADYAATFFRQ